MKNKRFFYRTLMVKVLLSGFALVFLLTTISCGTLSQAKSGAGETNALAVDKPTITLSASVAEFKAGVEILISGSGFKPKQELGLLITREGVLSDLAYVVKPEPVPNDLGAFVSVWKLGREIRTLEPLPTVYTMWVVDEDYNILCTAPICFCDLKAKEKAPACKFVK